MGGTVELVVRLVEGDNDNSALDRAIADLEDEWLGIAGAAQWPVEIAARVCPVFRYISGRPFP